MRPRSDEQVAAAVVDDSLDTEVFRAPHEAEAVGVAVVDNHSAVGTAIDAAVGIGIDAVDEALRGVGMR